MRPKDSSAEPENYVQDVLTWLQEFVPHITVGRQPVVDAITRQFRGELPPRDEEWHTSTVPWLAGRATAITREKTTPEP